MNISLSDAHWWLDAQHLCEREGREGGREGRREGVSRKEEREWTGREREGETEKEGRGKKEEGSERERERFWREKEKDNKIIAECIKKS